MTQVVTSAQQVVAVQDPQPFQPASPRLAAYIEAARRGSCIVPVPPDVQEAAWQHQRALEPLLVPAVEVQMLAWLRKLAPAVVNAPTDPADIQARAAAIWEHCGMLPAAVWCQETRVTWGRRPGSGKFWPAAGELHEHLAAYAATIANDRAGCERILAAGQGRELDAPDPRHDPAEQEAVTAILRAWRGNVELRHAEAAAADAPATPANRAIPVTAHELLRVHEAAALIGNRISGQRAAYLRNKLGVSTEDPVHAR